MTILDDIKLAVRDHEESKRILMVHPWNLLLAELATADFPNVTVEPHPWLPKDIVYLCDPNAIEAAARQSVQRSVLPWMWEA